MNILKPYMLMRINTKIINFFGDGKLKKHSHSMITFV